MAKRKKKKKSKKKSRSRKKNRSKKITKKKIVRTKSKSNKKKSRKKQQPKKNKDNSTPSEVIFKTKQEWIKNGFVNKAQYQGKYNESIKNNNLFWKKEGKRITWIKPYKKIKDVKYSKEEVKIKWYEDGTLNASANCIDRHLKDNGALLKTLQNQEILS